MVAFTSDGRQDQKLDTQIGKACAVMRYASFALQYSIFSCNEMRIVETGKALNF